MSKASTSPSRSVFKMPFFGVRQISSPEDQADNRRVYVGHTPISSIVDLSTEENVRDYLLDAEGKQRRRPTQVHRAIEETLRNNPQDFCVLNSGIVIVARECEIDEKEKVLRLTEPSIINGSQTQGVIRDLLKKIALDELPDLPFPVHIKFEVIVCESEALIAEISIARNLQNDVMSISIAGRLGQLDELEKRIQAKKPEILLQKSETKLSDDYYRTERLLQVITALIPQELWPAKKDLNKVYAYSMKAKCLKEFQKIYEAAKNSKDPDHEPFLRLYEFYLDIAPQAMELYAKWKTHQGFKGTGLRSIERSGREIVEVPDGIVFPILAALSAFAKQGREGWVIDPPASFADEELIRVAKTVYMEIAGHNPWNMGKSKSCYSSLHQITTIYQKLSK